MRVNNTTCWSCHLPNTGFPFVLHDHDVTTARTERFRMTTFSSSTTWMAGVLLGFSARSTGDRFCWADSLLHSGSTYCQRHSLEILEPRPCLRGRPDVEVDVTFSGATQPARLRVASVLGVRGQHERCGERDGGRDWGWGYGKGNDKAFADGLFLSFPFISKTAWMTSSPNETRNKLKDTPKVLAYMLACFFPFSLSSCCVLSLSLLAFLSYFTSCAYLSMMMWWDVAAVGC